MQANSRCDNYSKFIRHFDSGNCGKEGENIQKVEYFQNKESFLDRIKTYFIIFEIGFLLVK